MELRAAREKSGKTQAQVAKEANIGERLYQAYEYDEREPGVRTANRIARAVNSAAEILWGFGAATPDDEKKQVATIVAKAVIEPNDLRNLLQPPECKQ